MINRQLAKARDEALRYEKSLDYYTRKYNGKYFTGLPLSRLLATLALKHDCSTVIDPMAGHGDLLDATLEVGVSKSFKFQIVHGIEINSNTAKVCKNRLRYWKNINAIEHYHVFVNNAFDRSLISKLNSNGYDLVIANPPFVRYQNYSAIKSNNTAKLIRKELLGIVSSLIDKRESPIWETIIKHYSGHADLSIPATLLAAMLVRTDGILALVAPSAWESRDYASIIKYLLTKCFSLETVVTDKPPGWFPNALVRTQLIVAKKLKTSDVIKPIDDRLARNTVFSKIEIAPNIQTEASMVGVSFPETNSEQEFINWLNQDDEENHRDVDGLIKVQKVSVESEVAQLVERTAKTKWFRGLEFNKRVYNLQNDMKNTIHEKIRSVLLPIKQYNLRTITEDTIQIGQGLRTGCNDFFYVTYIEDINTDSVKVRLSNLFNDEELIVPRYTIRYAIRNQSDLKPPNSVENTRSLVLDLNRCVLPEDYPIVDIARESYTYQGKNVPFIMSLGLSRYVRRAQNTIYAKSHDNKKIPKLSAVITNVRIFNPEKPTLYPRFWYMLPDFAKRHLPLACIPRINHSTPWTIANSVPPKIVDANFSTIWQSGNDWTVERLIALLNSTWCKAYMEIVGTPLAGGALKLEAGQIKQIPIPMLSQNEKKSLQQLGSKLISSNYLGNNEIFQNIDFIVISSIIRDPSYSLFQDINHKLHSLIIELRTARNYSVQ